MLHSHVARGPVSTQHSAKQGAKRGCGVATAPMRSPRIEHAATGLMECCDLPHGGRQRVCSRGVVSVAQSRQGSRLRRPP